MSMNSDELLEEIYLINDQEEVIDSCTRAALERLIAAAMTGSVQGGHIADLLLAWLDADENGGFDLQSLWRIDYALVEDSLRLITWIGHNWRYPQQLGYADQFKTIRKQWRPTASIA